MYYAGKYGKAVKRVDICLFEKAHRAKVPVHEQKAMIMKRESFSPLSQFLFSVF